MLDQRLDLQKREKESGKFWRNRQTTCRRFFLFLFFTTKKHKQCEQPALNHQRSGIEQLKTLTPIRSINWKQRKAPMTATVPSVFSRQTTKTLAERRTLTDKRGILTGRRMSRSWWGRGDCVIGSCYTGRESTYIGPVRERRGPPMGPTTASTSSRSKYQGSPHRSTTLKISNVPIFIHRRAWRVSGFFVSAGDPRCINSHAGKSRRPDNHCVSQHGDSRERRFPKISISSQNVFVIYYICMFRSSV